MAGKKTEQKDAGYILLHRKIRNNKIIWDVGDPRKYMWWSDILMECNHEEKRVAFGFVVLICKRGESLNSRLTWAKRWRVNVNTVARFMKMLEEENMIVITNEQKTTRITVCNYESYNDPRSAKGFQKVSEEFPKGFRQDTNNTLLNTLKKEGTVETPVPPSDNNELPKDYRTWNKELFLQSLAKYQKKYERQLLLAFSTYWREPNPDGKMKFQLEKTWSTGGRLATWKRRGEEKQQGQFNNTYKPPPGQPVTGITDEILKNRELIDQITGN